MFISSFENLVMYVSLDMYKCFDISFAKYFEKIGYSYFCNYSPKYYVSVIYIYLSIAPAQVVMHQLMHKLMHQLINSHKFVCGYLMLRRF